MAAPIKRSAALIPGSAPAPIDEPTGNVDFVITEANHYRSREFITLAPSPDIIEAGSFITSAGAVAGDPASIAGIVVYRQWPIDAPIDAVVLVRDCEVRDASLTYGALDPAAVNAQLATKGIIVRKAVLPNVVATGFAHDEPPTPDQVISGIPPA